MMRAHLVCTRRRVCPFHLCLLCYYATRMAAYARVWDRERERVGVWGGSATETELLSTAEVSSESSPQLREVAGCDATTAT